MAEKRCQELEEFIRTNMKSGSLLSIEKCTPFEISNNQHFVDVKNNGTDKDLWQNSEHNLIETLTDNEDGSNDNGKIVFCVHTKSFIPFIKVKIEFTL